MDLEVKILCASDGAVDDAAAMLDAAGFDNFKRLGRRAAYDAAVLVEVDDGQMAGAPMGGAHILDAVGSAVLCACDGVVESLHVQERGFGLPWKWSR